MPIIEIAENAAALAEKAAHLCSQLAHQAIQARGRFVIALAGGSTPKVMYSLIAGSPDRFAVDWAHIHVCFGDERCVPPDHPDSNYRMVSETLLSLAPIPPGQVHRMSGELDPQAGAADYEAKLRLLFSGQNLPGFDLVLLGLGDDGHTASLFPGSPVLAETQRWVTSVEHTTPPPPLVTRLSLTFPAINASANVVFLVAGAAKQPILSKVLFSGAGRQDYPAQRVAPASGKLSWLIDKAAAGQG